MHSEFMGFVIDDASIFSLRNWAERQGYPQATVQQGGPDMFMRMLESASPPQMAVIDLDGQSDPVAATARIADICKRECRLVMIGSINDVTLYRHVIAAGAMDYLVKPLTPEQLNQALSAALRQKGNDKTTTKEARIVIVLGARGGVGASTIAINTGWIMGHDLGLKTILLDLDLQYGTSSLALDLEPGRGLRDILSSPHRVDSLMIASSMVSESDHFMVLGAEEAVDEVINIDGGAITALLKEMKPNFDMILIDLPRSLLASQKRLLPTAHDIVIVSELTLPGIRDTMRIKNVISSLGCTAQIRIVASRTQTSGAGQIDQAVFEKGIQGKIAATVVEDDATLTTAANTGKALGETAPRASITKALRDLATMLADVKQAPGVKKSLWASFTAKKKNKGVKDKDGVRSGA